MSGIMSGVKPIKMANGGLVPSGGLPYGSPQGALGGYGGMGLGTGSGYAEGGDVDYKELAKGIGSFAGEMLDPRDPINALLYALYLFPPAGVAATAGKLAYAGGKGIKAARAAKKAKRLSKLAPELTGKKGYDLGHKGGLGAYLALEAQELFGDEDVEEDEEEVIENADGGLIERPVLYAAKGKAIKKVIEKVKDKKKKKAAAEKKKKAAEANKKKADAEKQKKADEKTKKDREEAEKKRAEEQKTADEKIRKEEADALANRSGFQKYQDWRRGLGPLHPGRYLLPGSKSQFATVPGALWWGSKKRAEADKKRQQAEAIQAAIESQQTQTDVADAQAEREATTAEKRRRNRALIAAGREMTKYTEGHVPYNWLSDAATAYSDTMAGKDQPELIQTAYAMMAENPELEFEDALRSVLSRGAVEVMDPELKEIQLIQQIPGMEEYAEFLMQNYALSKLSPEALEALPDVTEIE